MDMSEGTQPSIAGFCTLPEELRTLIWEATLPNTRVFQVHSVHRIEQQTARTLQFHIKHAQPISLSVCKESRLVAQRRGFFIGSPSFAQSDAGGLWFNPSRDILYVDRHNRSLFNRTPDGPIQGVDRVQHLGVEWRAVMANTSAFSHTGDMRAVWRPMFRNLRPYVPKLKALHYMLPAVRVPGCYSWAREPYKSHEHDATLDELPQQARIPWCDSLSTSRVGRTHPVALPDAGPGIKAHEARTRGGFLGYYMYWEDVRRGLEMAMREACEDAEEAMQRRDAEEVDEYGRRGDWRDKRNKVGLEEVQVVGWRLRRVGVVYGEEDGNFVGLDGKDE